MENIYEMLVIFDRKDKICTSKDSLKSLIRTSDEISEITNKSIKIGEDEFSLTINQMDIEESQEQITYLIKIEFNEEQKKVFNSLRRVLRKTIDNIAGDRIYELWNGLSLEYSVQLYKEINIVENLMRKLITLFMILKLGDKWEAKALPEGIEKNSTKKEIKNNNGIVYNIDFIVHTDILFKKYSIKNVDHNLIEELKAVKNNEEKLDNIINSIYDYIPRNNWDRYFSEILSCESGFLGKKWKRLYEIRCLVAHNNTINQGIYEEAQVLCDELSNILKKAIKELQTINVPEKEKEIASSKPMQHVYNSKTLFNILNSYNWDKVSSLKKLIKNQSNIEKAISNRGIFEMQERINEVFSNIDNSALLDGQSSIEEALSNSDFRAFLEAQSSYEKLISDSEIKEMQERINEVSPTFDLSDNIQEIENERENKKEDEQSTNGDKG